jgi:hypothetical protein
LAAGFVPAGLAALWLSEESCNEVVARIALTKMMTHQGGFILKSLSSLSSALIQALKNPFRNNPRRH